jgi:uncharacterized protein YcfJ
MAINTQKFLPASKPNALAIRTSKINVDRKNIGPLVKTEEGVLAKEILKMKVKIINLQGEVDKNKKLNQKEQSDKIRNQEKEKRAKREKKLESKDGKGVILPNVISRLPGGSIVDAIKRYLGFTFLGWLVGKYETLMPQLEKFISIAKPVFDGLVFTTSSILKGIYGFVEAGYKAYDSVSATIRQVGGENAEKTFHDFSNHLNNLLNGTLMVAMLAVSTAPKAPVGTASGVAKVKGFGGNRPGQGGRPKVTTSGGRPLGKPDTRNPFKSKPSVTTSADTKSVGKFAKFGGGRIPVIGPLLTFGIRTMVYGERPEKAAAAAIGTGLGQVIGGALGTAATGGIGFFTAGLGLTLAPFIIGASSLVGGLIGEWIGASLFDFVSGFGKNKKTVGKARGGIVSKQNRKPRRRVATAPPSRRKIQPQQTQPGKDIGGRYKIEEFYGEEKISTTGTTTRGEKIVKALEKTSNDVKKLPLDWMASIGGAYIDMTMGQRPDKKLASDIGKSFGAFVDTVINNEVTASTNQITKALVGMANGGSIPQNDIERNQISKKVEKNIEERLQTIFDQSYSIVNKNLKRESLMQQAEDIRQMRERLFGGEGGGGEGGAGGYATGSENFVSSQEIYSYLKSKGLSHNHIMGMLANIQAESSFNSGAIGDGGDSGGLFQHNKSRFEGMVAFAGKDWAKNWKRQIDYSLREDAGKQYANKQFKTAEEASAWFTLNFERPANKEYKARQRLDNLKNFGMDGSWKGERPIGIIKGGKIKGGAIVTQRQDPDAEQTGSDIAIGNYKVGAQIQNPFQSLKIKQVGFHGSGSGETGRGYGRYIVAETNINGKKYEILLGHLDKALVRPGDILEAGDIIGTQGISGRAFGPHVTTHVNALGSGGNPGSVLKSIENVWVNGGMIKTNSMGKPSKPSKPQVNKSGGGRPSTMQQLRNIGVKSTTGVVLPSIKPPVYRPAGGGMYGARGSGGVRSKSAVIDNMKKGGNVGSTYSSLNSIKEDTSINKEMVVIYQKEIVMVSQTV